MADPTYGPKVYHKQGGDEQVVASGGKVTVESGGEIDVESGGALKLAGTAVTSTAAELNILDGATVTPAELNVLDGQVLAEEAGEGITGGTDTIYASSVTKIGGIIKTSILLDLDGLSSSTTDLDIIGQGAEVAHLGQITEAQNGTILTGRVTCLEVPVGGVDDIDLYAATEDTGVFDGDIASLTETALVTSGAAWTLGLVRVLSAMPVADAFLYLTGGDAGTAAEYSAGKFLIELEGY